jgi:hypothetical protein
MAMKITMVYWKSGRFRLGKLLEHAEIMARGETVEELEENLEDAWLLKPVNEEGVRCAA